MKNIQITTLCTFPAIIIFYLHFVYIYAKEKNRGKERRKSRDK